MSEPDFKTCSADELASFVRLASAYQAWLKRREVSEAILRLADSTDSATRAKDEVKFGILGVSEDYG